MIAETKKDKAAKLQEIRKFLKKQVKWQPPSKNLMPVQDLGKVYEGERYMVLSSRNDKNPDVMECAIFTDDQKGYDAILTWNPDFKQQVYDLTDFSLVKEHTRKVGPDLKDFINELDARKDAATTSD